MTIKEILIPVASGELIDKITILEIKQERITDKKQQKNVRHELERLTNVLHDSVPSSPELTSLRNDLKAINEKLWNVEDDIREKESSSSFDAGFIELARAVYNLNDKRAELKRKISLLLGSDIIEEKSYHPV